MALKPHHRILSYLPELAVDRDAIASSTQGALNARDILPGNRQPLEVELPDGLRGWCGRMKGSERSGADDTVNRKPVNPLEGPDGPIRATAENAVGSNGEIVTAEESLNPFDLRSLSMRMFQL